MDERATFGGELRRLRQNAGLSLAGLAARVHYSKSYLSKIENELMPPNAAFAEVCETELGAAGVLKALLPAGPARRRTALDVVPSGLPPVTTLFTGRVTELRAIREVLRSEGGICVVSGLGGVGKTALAVRCAQLLEPDFADGCLFIDLRGLGEPPVSPSVVHDRVLRLLGVPAEGVPADPEDRAAVYRAHLRDRRTLLVLDNAGSAAQVRSLLPGGPKCRVLVTSRSRLTALDEAGHVPVDVLPLQDATELFAVLVGADGVAEGGAQVVQRCGRIPLAIRIAAARLRAHPVWDIGDLDRRLADESALLGELDDGERSLAATFRLSARDLEPAEARLFSLLALHPGADFDVAAASALGGLPVRDADRLVERLYNAHLLGQPAVHRYGFHDLVRTFAATLPDASSEGREALRRLFDHYLATASAADRLITPGRFQVAATTNRPAGPELLDAATAMQWLRAELPALVALVQVDESALDRHRWQLAFTLRGYFYLAKELEAWLETHVAALAACRRLGDRRAEALTLNNLGMGLAAAGRLDEATDQHLAARALFDALGDRHGVSDCLANLGAVLARQGRFAEALEHQQQALQYYSAAGLTRNSGITLRSMATAHLALGEVDEAVRCAAEALALALGRRHDLDVAQAANALGAARERKQDYSNAEVAWRQALAHGERCGSVHEQATARWGLGRIAMATGRIGEAETFLRAARELYELVKSPRADEVAESLAAFDPS
ncbi:ATP-binding protein [Amycolatopsis sp. lyj-23]|uniref:ATP-binding protein n=1 Tax=Amycolatopsis sp. lyj-23 TaxID=2789283 RepID=UPI0039791F91